MFSSLQSICFWWIASHDTCREIPQFFNAESAVLLIGNRIAHETKDIMKVSRIRLGRRGKQYHVRRLRRYVDQKDKHSEHSAEDR